MTQSSIGTNLEHLKDLRKLVTAFPKLPGVYLMRDEKEEVIYVGKAKDLRARVRTYLTGGDGRAQIQYLMRRVRGIDKIVTDSEEQAFVLERDLIQKYKPRYNIRLKDDKSYLSIRIDTEAEWPRLELVRRVEHDGAQYFGPYTFSYELRTLLDIIKRVVPLRTCTNTVFYNRQRPCLEYQIKRCAGPCCLPVDREEYTTWVEQAIRILDGQTEPIITELEAVMERASEDLRFEDAAILRDRIEILRNFRHGQELVSSQGENRDVFFLYREDRLATISVLQVRNGRISDNVNFALSEVEVSDEEVLESAIEQFYESGREIPDEVILQLELENMLFLKTVLSQKRGGKVELLTPKRGIKFRLLGLAELNAKQHYLAVFDAEARYRDIARTLSKLLQLQQIPRRIECVDISNLQGSDIVGALVTFFDGSPDKSQYKKYKISQQGKPDDFAAIYEVVSRRLARAAEQDDLPDLLIIDGGRGQLAKALEARDELELSLDIVSIAKMRNEKRRGKAGNIQKKPERIFIPGSANPIILDGRSEVTHFLQRVRDEVHRFAITFHRKTRSKRVFLSVLDEIRGVGPERRRRLLKEFGSVEGMKGKSVEEIARAGRMPKSLAQKVLERIDATS